MVTLPGYKLTQEIHVGVNTVIYRGHRELETQIVIIKLLQSKYPTLKESARFKHEYEINNLLDFDGIVKNYRLETLHNCLALIVEYFGGESLKNYITERKLELIEFLKIAVQLAKILKHIHEKNIIHKDIKPSHIIFNPETETVKITDFAIASRLSRENHKISTGNMLEGTLAYMSPEQTGRMNRSIDYRTDFYSLGVTFYEILTGTLPFTSTDPMELVHCHIAKTPVPPQELNPEVPLAVSDIVMKLLAKTAEERYQSALGLKADLETCLSQLEVSGQISNFIPGQQDLSGQLLIPQKLYGREAEVATLMATFERISQPPLTKSVSEKSLFLRRCTFAPPKSPLKRGTLRKFSPLKKGGWGGSDTSQTPSKGGQGGVEMILVAGYSGIGKSALVQEIHKPIVRQRGYFISGKFDQFKRDIPYSSIIQAFQELIRQLLTESAQKVADWKSKLLKAFGSNGLVITEVIPEVELIIDPQPPVPQLGQAEAQNRFNRVFQKFIQVFTQKEHPLVLFLDDLQWTDSASLKFIQLLMTEPDSQYLLLIGAYRDNEVSATHPLMLTLEKIQETGAKLTTITLRPLDIGNVSQLVGDTLNSEASKAYPLAELVFNKTQGNPFFLTQLLKSLYQEKLLSFDFTPPPAVPSLTKGRTEGVKRDRGSKGGWQWDIEQLQGIDITDNVVELMVSQIQKLEPTTQNVLKLAACIGNKFTLDVLAIVNEKSLSETAAELWESLEAGLVLPRNNSYKIPLVFDSEEMSNWEASGSVSIAYKFLHDRVQQAAYSLIPDSQKKQTHLKIGELLLKHTPETEIEESIFEVVNHLNIGAEFITQQSQKDVLIKLNLIAGQKAKSATAYVAATEYFYVGLGLLRSASWQSQYDLTLNLHIAAIEAEYFNTNYQKAKALIDIAIKQAKTILEQSIIYDKKIKYYTSQGDFKSAIDTGIEALDILGTPLKTDPENIKILSEQLRAELVFETSQIAELLNLPVMVDAVKMAAIKTLITLIPPVYFRRPDLLLPVILTMVSLSVKYGNAAPSAYGYCLYGLLLCGALGDINSGYEFGRLSLKVLEQFEPDPIKCQVFKVFASHIQPWKEPLRAAMENFLTAIQTGLETGNSEYIAYGCAEYCMYLFFTGENIQTVEQKYVHYVDLLEKLKQEFGIFYIKVGRQAALNLVGNGAPCYLTGDSFDEETMLPKMVKADYKMPLFCFYLFKLILTYLFKDYEAAVANADLAATLLEGVVGTLYVAQHNFYHSLALLGQYPTLSASEQEQALLKVATNQESLQNWAFHAPCNFEHKYKLIEAEKARVLGQIVEAMEYYDQAIQGARNAGYTQEEALANELAAEFYLTLGRQKLAQMYLTDAYSGYIQWGAVVKVKKLETRYPQLLDKASVTNPIRIQATSTHGDSLDLTTVVKASQALAGEIVLSKLIDKLIKIVIENAGARTGFLILEKSGNLVIEAVGSVDRDVVFLQSTPVEASQELPLSLINYVTRTKSDVVLSDATAEGIFTADPYIAKNQPKSLLCMPIIHQGTLTGLLYLENNLTTAAFTPDRLEVLKIISSQAAISLKNARLYTNLESANHQLEDYSRTLEVKVEERTQELQEKNVCLQQEISASEAAARHRLIAETALRQSEARLAEAQRVAHVGNWEFDLVTSEISWSEEMFHIFGLDPTQSPPTYSEHKQQVHPDDKEFWENTIWQNINEAKPYEFDFRILRADGSVRHINAKGQPILNDQGKVTKVFGTVLDITERKEAEVVMQQAKVAAEAANRAKSEFLANMSHELRTPLNGILGYAQILKQEKSLTSKQQDGLGIIQRCGEHLLNLINEILDLSKIESRKMELHLSDFHFPEFLKSITEIVSIRAKQKGISFTYESLSPLPTGVRGDEIRLRQVLLNLLGNAVKFTETGGVMFKVGIQEGKIRFQIEDTGIGIEPSKLEEIFLPFHQVGASHRRVEGTGLGLAISQKLVQMMGGEIKMKSLLGKGSKFFLDLNLPEVLEWTEVETTDPDNIIGFKGSKRKVLVVDDKGENRSILVNLLEPLGFEICEAADGQDALNKTIKFKPDLVFMDLVMPVMDGFETTRQLRQETTLKDVVVIATSASVFDFDQQSSRLAGCDDFLPKPVRVQELLERLKVHLGLEWVYEESEELKVGRLKVETLDLQPLTAPTENKQLTNPQLIAPSKEELTVLFDLAMRGNIRGIGEAATRLEQLDAQFVPFARELHQLVKGFQERRIREFIQNYMESPE